MTWQRLDKIIPDTLRNQPISWFKYVTHDSVEDYLSKGWVIADTLFGTKHGDFSVLMRWAGEGEPK